MHMNQHKKMMSLSAMGAEIEGGAPKATPPSDPIWGGKGPDIKELIKFTSVDHWLFYI